MSALEKVLQELFPSEDPLDSAEFDAVTYINKRFPNEQSLSEIDSVQHKLKDEMNQVNKEIRNLIREQASESEAARSQLDQSQGTVSTLQEKVGLIRSKAQTSEEMVEDICKDIRSLDTAKRNLTKTITSLKRLGMATQGIAKLAEVCEAKQYRMAAALIKATGDLMLQFEECKHVPAVANLTKQRNHILKELRMQILEDFRELQNMPEEVLSEACLVVEELGEQVKTEVVKHLSSYFLENYNSLFKPGEMHSGFEYIERRYAWLKRCLRDIKENYEQIFPEHWNIQAEISREFCETTKDHIGELLGRTDTDTSNIVSALQKTKKFEQELTKKFAAQQITPNRGSSIQLDDALGGYEEVTYSRPVSKAAPVPKFEGVVSSSFNSHLNRFCESEEQTLLENIDQFMSEDNTAESNVFPSSIRLFNSIKATFNKCLSFCTGPTLYQLSKVFKRVLQTYCEKLCTYLPRLDRPVKLSENEVITLAFVVNTAEYCRTTILEMETTVRAKLETQYDVEFYEEVNTFIDLAGKAVQSLVLALEGKIEPHFTAMQKANWVLEEVGDKSEYCVKITEVLLGICSRVTEVLNEDYLLTYLNKVAESINGKFVSSIYKCKKISEYGAQQMLLDCFELKTKFLSLHPKSPAFSSVINKLFSKTEALLKVLSSPPERVHETYDALIENPNQADLDKILVIMGIKKSEKPWEALKQSKKLWNFS